MYPVGLDLVLVTFIGAILGGEKRGDYLMRVPGQPRKVYQSQSEPGCVTWFAI
jgi:hypothetical protein